MIDEPAPRIATHPTSVPTEVEIDSDVPRPGRLSHREWTPSRLNRLARELAELTGGDWVPWHYGLAVPDAAVLARYTETQAGRRVLSGVLLLGDALTADQLRKVPVAALERAHNLRTREDRDRLRAELSELPPLKRTPEMSPDDFAKLVASHYKVWARAVPHPAAEMAQAWDVKVPTMHTWIREARLRGHLPPARRRKST